MTRLLSAGTAMLLAGLFMAASLASVPQSAGRTAGTAGTIGTIGTIGTVGTIAVAELPQEARAVLALIKRGGPYRYRQDGAVFGNREGRLPARKRGYYREYTVPTPGATDRGARRIVAGEDAQASGEAYYSDDHYNSFRRIKRPFQNYRNGP